MTCIVGLKQDNKVWIGADTQHSRGTIKLKDNSPKIFKKGNFTIAGAGSARGSQLLFYGIDLNDFDWDKDEKEMVIKLADKIQDINRVSKHYSEDKGVERGETYFLVAINNRLFCVEFNYFVHEIESFIAIGSANDFAEGVLSYINQFESGLSPDEKISRTLELIEQYDTSISNPFTIVEVD